mmetsp:Transcript_18958/g.48328  ORF Transcript_18958/g.48328 Transcript_18958/m.48328 type:complete len:300 (+) Transcript_18958:1759-2658(+)
MCAGEVGEELEHNLLRVGLVAHVVKEIEGPLSNRDIPIFQAGHDGALVLLDLLIAARELSKLAHRIKTQIAVVGLARGDETAENGRHLVNVILIVNVNNKVNSLKQDGVRHVVFVHISVHLCFFEHLLEDIVEPGVVDALGLVKVLEDAEELHLQPGVEHRLVEVVVGELSLVSRENKLREKAAAARHSACICRGVARDETEKKRRNCLHHTEIFDFQHGDDLVLPPLFVYHIGVATEEMQQAESSLLLHHSWGLGGGEHLVHIRRHSLGKLSTTNVGDGSEGEGVDILISVHNYVISD